jgi:diguanylate cyclase (GGDEF)-like protein
MHLGGSGVDQGPDKWKAWVVATPGIAGAAKTAARSALIDAVFNSTLSIASGGISCLLIGLATAWRCDSIIPLVWTVIHLCLVVGRLVLNARYAQASPEQKDKDCWALGYAAGALLTAITLGLASGLAIALDLPSALLVGLAAIGSAGGIAGRNSALPRLASAQCVLLIVPTGLAGFWSAEPVNIMLIPCAFGYGAALFSFIWHYYSETSALIVARLDDAALARHDALTGIPNRRSFEERLAALWPGHHRPTEPLALLMIDIDFFKRYNDLYGHPAGDDCLRHIAMALRDQLGEDELVARFGGEEFAILLPRCSLDQALILGNNLCRAVVALGIEQAMRTDDMDVVTISVGIGASSAALSAQHLIEVADRSLYRAKAGGRNRVHPDSAETLVALQRINKAETPPIASRRA